MTPTADKLLPTLLARREELIAFLVPRLGGRRADAEDLLQQGMVKAIAAAPALRKEDRLVPWFHQLLRHAVIDHVRSHRAAEARERRWAEETAALAPDALVSSPHLCRCLAPLIDSLPPQQAELVRRVELGEEAVGRAADALGLSPNAASVALHRARTRLRAKLQAFCGDCASGACLDCDCDETLPEKTQDSR